MSPTFRALSIHNYRLWADRRARLEHRHLDAARRPGLAGPHPLTDNSGTAVGITTGLQFAPMLLLAPWPGVLADRFDRRKSCGHPDRPRRTSRRCSASSC